MFQLSFSQQLLVQKSALPDLGWRSVGSTGMHGFQLFYMSITLLLALFSICLEVALSRNAKVVKRHNEALLLNNKVMIKQNFDLQQTLKALEDSREDNRKMFQVIAHDLRSPMAAIVGLSGFMVDENKLAEEDMEVIRLVHTSGVDSLKFINGILDREGRLNENTLQRIDLYALLFYCIEQLKYKAQEKGQQILLEGRPCIELNINREKLWRVIHNLISNALKFSPEKSLVVVGLELIPQWAVISIKDEGIGIPEELRDKIFNLTAECKREGTAGEKSFGMGLAIAKQMIEAHQGKLTFKSEVGKGTTFLISLPVDHLPAGQFLSCD
ncbi:MAG: HAMP domain-containing sensor histidine kinase [Pedobacter sp.]|nr:HAMP domain-containing sensor histidine kinase [Pedobacter sp.]